MFTPLHPPETRDGDSEGTPYVVPFPIQWPRTVRLALSLKSLWGRSPSSSHGLEGRELPVTFTRTRGGRTVSSTGESVSRHLRIDEVPESLLACSANMDLNFVTVTAESGEGVKQERVQ